MQNSNWDNDTWAPLIGRLLLAFVYITAGLGKIAAYEGTAGYMASQGMPLISILLPLTILLEIGGGILIAVGFFTRPAALAIIAFTVVASLIFHQFWAAPAEQAQLQQIMFFKNIGLVGGFLLLIAFGPGRWSLDARRTSAVMA